MSEFDDKIALVTGGSRGIGRAVTAELAARGADVSFTWTRGEEAAAEVERETGARGLRCDSRDSAAVEESVERLVAERGQLDVLVCNAGITRDQYLMLMSEDDFSAVVDTNLTGAFRFAKAACRPMLTRRSGAIVTVASVAALFGVAGQLNYCASKGGLVAMTRALAAELAPRGIRVNSVLPGFVETEMTAKMPRRIKRESLERILLGRFARSEEVASVVAFLASEAASYLVGQAIVVDGGMTSTVA